jgi:hypothetical protein
MAMTRVSIQVEDNIVVVDRKVLTVDCSPLREKRISAVQWYDDHGEVEFERHHKGNEIIHSLEEFQSLVTAAKPIPSPKPPTPQELDEMHNRFMLEHPEARAAWEQRDAEVKRLHREAQLRDPRYQEMLRELDRLAKAGDQRAQEMLDELNAQQPNTIAPAPTTPPLPARQETAAKPEKSKPKPKKK